MTRVSIEEGVSFILSHFRGDNALYPHRIAAGEEWSISVECDYEKVSDNPLRYKPLPTSKQMISLFYDAKLRDCRISPYPNFTDDFAKSDCREAWLYGSLGIVPDFIMIDIDKGAFTRTLHTYDSDKQALNQALYYVLGRINEKFGCKCCPTVVWTGNGYHIYLPVQLSGPSWCLGHTDAFMNLSKTPDRDFLRWAEWYLSDGLCDPAHRTTTSFKNMYCRVPGSFNSKNNEPVVILQKWDGNRPYINHILKAFYEYLVDKKPKSKKRHDSTLWSNSTKWN
jgi:hypothetical protein